MLSGKDDGIKNPSERKKKMDSAPKVKSILFKKRILVAPLNWGLGHATRCMPIIQELITQGCTVVVAADGRPYDLLKKEFHSLEFHRLPGFAPTYHEKGAGTFHLLRQLPALLKATITEHSAVERLIREATIDAIISDSRFGLFSSHVPTIYLVHQIRILMPKWLRMFERLVYYIHRHIIMRYTECWIPDYGGERNLSGNLSHSFVLPQNSKFIGPLSRFSASAGKKNQHDVLVILSGPEPQRTVLEKKLVEQLSRTNLVTLIVQGIPEANQHTLISPTLTMVSMLTAAELNSEILSSKIILSRPGYSTIMDLAALSKKAIFVPTPGQTEQEYLAKHFHEKKVCFSMSQAEFDLHYALEAAKAFSGFVSNNSTESQLARVIADFLSQLQAA